MNLLPPQTFDMRIEDKIQEAPGVVTLRLRPLQDRNLDFLPGQFAMLGFKDETNLRWKSRSYSMSSSPLTKDYLDFTMKICKEWTTRMSSMPIGAVIEVRFPFGKFTLDESPDDVVFIAGGVGVTPFISMIRYLSQTHSERRARLIYSVRTSWLIIFHKQLEEIARQWPNLNLLFTISDEDNEDHEWAGRRGRIDLDLIKKELETPQGKIFYVCGPNAMMAAMLQYLSEFGVSKEKIRTETFG